MPEGLLRYLMVGAVAAINLGLALVVGAFASQLWLRGRDSTWRTAVLAQGRSASRFGFILALIGLLASAWFEAASMAETPLLQAGAPFTDLVLRTHYGHAWIVGLLAWPVASLPPVLRGNGEHRPVAFGAALMALSVFIASRSVVSHAGSRGDLTVDVAVDCAHLVLVSLWVGMVLAGARLAMPSDDASPNSRTDATLWAQRMSTTATVALGAIAATGLFKVWRVVTPALPLKDFVGSAYAMTLVAKLALVAIAVALGGLNRFVVLPRLFRQLKGHERASPWRTRLIVILRFEAATLALVVVAASLLSGTEPPAAS